MLGVGSSFPFIEINRSTSEAIFFLNKHHVLVIISAILASLLFFTSKGKIL